uniref:Carboxymuconolactone decarboxylase family protein n=1 Tax=Candidatus Methanosuratincola petrocarbonis (ex Vanwonterghem et al. 2016) TaxID=1867261 RepID=A0A7J3UZD2_9CREN
MRRATEELAETLDRLSKSPYGAILSAWRRFTAAAHAEGELTRKHKELIAIALSISKGCEHCVSYHVRAALAAGASPGEIIEAAFVAVIMGGGPALAQIGFVLDAIEAHSARESHE